MPGQTFTVQLNSDGTADPDPLTVHIGDKVVFQAPATDARDIDFPAGSPFANSHYHVPHGQATPPNPVVHGSAGQRFGYNNSQAGAGAGGDPIIIIGN